MMLSPAAAPRARVLPRDEHAVLVVGGRQHRDELLAQRRERRVVEPELQAQSGVRDASAASQQRQRALHDLTEGRHERTVLGAAGALDV